MTRLTNDIEVIEAPHHRGFFVTRINGWLSTYIDVGSKRFLSVPRRDKSAFFATGLFVYGSDARTNVAIVDNNGERKQLWRFFIKSRFPYITRNADGGGYKSFHLKWGFAKNHAIQIECATGTYEVCQIAHVADVDLLHNVADIQAELAHLEKSKELRRPENLARLERSLIQLQKTTPARDINKALIILYCLFEFNHRQAHKRLGIWSAKEKSRGGAQNVQDFQKQLLSITNPLALGRHGFNPSFQNLDLDRVETELHTLMSDLTGLDVQPFLNSGTLLGYFRDGRPIPHDDDFDLGILVKGDTEDEAAQNWRRFVKAVGEKIRVINKGSFVALKLSNGVQVDLFACWTVDGNLFVHPYCWADIGEDALLPMAQLNVRGRDFPIPADPDAVLSVNYGPNWRVPDPFWRFDYRKSKHRFRQVLKKLKN